MAPSIHPPCTPSASCVPVRCHPSIPPCKNPEKCLKKTISKGVRPCQSAVSIMATRSKTKCSSCGKFKGAANPRSVPSVQKFLKRKSKESKMRKQDRLTGSNSYTKYKRRQGKRRSSTDCCAAVYSTKGIKPCVSAPTCSAHRHRPRPAPCPDPDKCYKKCIKKKSKCPSAMETITRPGSPCDCARVQSKDSRVTKKRGFKTHRKRLRKAYKRNSMESRWRKRRKCCVIL
ncbi:unnamed protein product [Diatraea saccharalis]|uniref:Uncharacterized protein n=1 Tax=Diatraea saccharalis TaxID=40085 RepID=A0A9N9RC36_9NEOP|nr:unnamed protein product [Diatraea saccharalis]